VVVLPSELTKKVVVREEEGVMSLVKEKENQFSVFLFYFYFIVGLE